MGDGVLLTPNEMRLLKKICESMDFRSIDGSSNISDWYMIKEDAVIDIIEKRKDRLPWGNYPNQKYICLIFWKDEQIYMTVDTFYKDDDNCYLCCKYYTSVIAKSMDDYNSMPEEKFVLKAYNTWMTGAR